MLRTLVVAGAALIVVQTAGGSACAAQSVCNQSCPDDAPDGTCPPGCNDCSCCAHVNPAVAPRPLVETVEPAMQDAPTFSTALPPSPEPNDILHVPKSLLA